MILAPYLIWEFTDSYLDDNEMALTGANVITGLEKPRNPTISK